MRRVDAATGASRGAERIDGMRTVIEGGWVVAWNGRSHEVHEQGSVVFGGERIVHAGGPYAGSADTRIPARGKLVSPGFINTHVHTAGNGGDYLLLDMAKNDYRTSNYMAFAAPLKGKMAPPSPEATAAIDSVSDAAFRAALRESVLPRGCAVLTIAHRLSTAAEADRVIVLDGGRIVEEGPPGELAGRGGRFAALLELEAAGWDWRSGP